ncbi:hypothetical protein ACFVRU_01350 [Streptomyces sp. NPDC057927]
MAGLPLAYAGDVLPDAVDVVADVVDAHVQSARDALQGFSRRCPLLSDGTRGASVEGEECGDSRDHGRAKY